MVRKNKLKRVAEGDLMKFSNEHISIMNVSNLKHPIANIKWIGLNQLLFIDSAYKLYYL